MRSAASVSPASSAGVSATSAAARFSCRRCSLRVPGIDVEAELGGDHHLTTHRRQALADQFLVGERTIDLGRAEESHAEVDRLAQQPDHLVLTGGQAVVHAHAHAAETDGRDLEAAPAKARIFMSLPLVWIVSAVGKLENARGQAVADHFDLGQAGFDLVHVAG